MTVAGACAPSKPPTANPPDDSDGPELPAWVAEHVPSATGCEVRYAGTQSPAEGRWTLVDRDGWTLAEFDHPDAVGEGSTTKSAARSDVGYFQLERWTYAADHVQAQVDLTVMSDGVAYFPGPQRWVVLDSSGRVTRDLGEGALVTATYDTQGRVTARTSVSTPSDPSAPSAALHRVERCTHTYTAVTAVERCAGDTQRCDEAGCQHAPSASESERRWDDEGRLQSMTSTATDPLGPVPSETRSSTYAWNDATFEVVVTTQSSVNGVEHNTEARSVYGSLDDAKRDLGAVTRPLNQAWGERRSTIAGQTSHTARGDACDLRDAPVLPDAMFGAQ
jgi:hypothetical protein